MNKEQKECFKLLENELNYINLKWQIYNQLYGSCKENIDLLNDFAPTCFGIYQRTLFDDIILSISRLTDPRKQNGHVNLTLKSMLYLVNVSSNNKLNKKLKKSIKIISTICKNIRVDRNKRIGHNDLDSITTNFDSINGISRLQIKKALSAISDFMIYVVEDYIF